MRIFAGDPRGGAVIFKRQLIASVILTRALFYAVSVCHATPTDPFWVWLIEYSY